MFHHNSNSLLLVTLIMKTMAGAVGVGACVCVRACMCGDVMFIPWPGQVLISTGPTGFIHLSLFWGLNEGPDSWKQEVFQQLLKWRITLHHHHLLLAKCLYFIGNRFILIIQIIIILLFWIFPHSVTSVNIHGPFFSWSGYFFTLYWDTLPWRDLLYYYTWLKMSC